MRSLLIIIALLTCCLSSGLSAQTPLSNNEKSFITEMVKNYGFSKSYLTNLLSNAKVLPRAIHSVKTPYEAKPWYQYRKIFLSKSRIDQGARYWRRYRTVFTQVSKQTGIPPEILVAIVGVETHYGKIEGKFPAFNVLYTLAFHFNDRPAFFRKELKQFLILTRKLGKNPLTIKSSYAGALGQPQFMPSSYLAYAKAYKGKKMANLFSNPADVITSIANYFVQNGWQANQPVAVKASVKGKHHQALPLQPANQRIEMPHLTLAKLSSYGIKPTMPLSPNMKATLMRFTLQNGNAYWLGFHNFYVITRYNTSKHYALAVFQLAQAIRQRYNTLY